ncbi:ATP synthase F0 subunit B [Streptomyces sp. WM4235]|uniref:F0F1 ATP synthase subunit B family protein n=1 Tax=Streptomyces sp. WM4235 TaxID=1415551 RepID=UPI0006AE69FE|nr:ATP synthase F0 subunit B [Streptomyces sp. WM4235]KOU42054.1 ATP synthase F0 subunit B [Streptomyces sp. WM4235]
MGPLKPNLIELIVGLISFCVVLAAMAKVLPRIEKTLAEREEATAGTLEQAEAVRLEAQRIRAEYQAELSAARHEASRIRQAAHEEGVTLLAVVRAEGQKAREEMVVAAIVQLEADRVIAEAELREDVLGLATELAGRVIGEPITDLDRDRAVADDFFAGEEAATKS